METLDHLFQRMNVVSPPGSGVFSGKENVPSSSEGCRFQRGGVGVLKEHRANVEGGRPAKGASNGKQQHWQRKDKKKQVRRKKGGKATQSPKENNSKEKNGHDPRRVSDSSECLASGSRQTTKNPPPRATLELLGGIPLNHAHDICDACMKKDSAIRSSLRSSWVVLVSSKDLKEFSVILEFSGEMTTNQKEKLIKIFAKHESKGFVEWLGGAKGWRFDCPKTESTSWKKRFVIQLNSLQSVFTLFASDEQKYFFVDEKKRMVWRKHAELTDVVSDVRVFVETIKPRTCLTRQLLRSSNAGPDSPVHWAHHHPKNSDYPLTVVTETTMLELVEGIIQLFQQEFNHSESDPLGTRWRQHEKRRRTDWNDAPKVCPEWTEDCLEQLLNGYPAQPL
ncbi:hypothetical protein ACHAWF_012290 [Thalassiosira exigua]